MKTTKQISLGLAAALVCTAIACSKKTDDDKKQVVVSYSQQSSEELALAGEQLITPSSFALADKVLDEALAKDSNNKRAQFYKKFLKPIMALRGIGARIRPAIREHGDIAQHENGIANIPNSSTRDFILDGQEDIRTVTDMQNLLVKVRDGYVDFYNWLKANENSELVLNINPYMMQGDAGNQAVGDCRVVNNDSDGMTVDCNNREMLQRKLSTPDLIALRQMIGGTALYFTIYTSYSFDGIEDLVEMSKTREVPSQETFQTLETLPNFGKLRADNTMKMIRTFGSDFAAAWKYAMANQARLCPSPAYSVRESYGYSSTRRRKGHVFEDGFCTPVDSEHQKNLDLLNQALQGPIMIGDVKDSNAHIRANLFAWSDRPVTSLKNLFPVSYNACGKATVLRDKTMGGLYPDGDAEKTLDTQCN